jgi:iron complex outermembrane recepter protein
MENCYGGPARMFLPSAPRGFDFRESGAYMQLKPTCVLKPGTLAGSLVVAVLSPPLLASEQDPHDGRFAEIIVTAERRLADIQSVPLSVTAVTEDDIRSLALRDSVDVALAVPGVQFDQQGMGATPFIRGVGAMSGAIGNEAPVSMYVDGVYVATPNASVFALDGVSQIEVLKGPQGTLFGRNATGGVVQVVTREPDPDAATELQVQYASNATARASLYATGGFGDSTLASLSLYGRDQQGGWGTNLTTGGATFRHEEYGARGKVLLTPGSATRLLVSATHFHKRGEDGLGYHFAPGSLGLDGKTGYSGFYNAWADPQDRADYRHSVVSARIEHDFSASRLVSISSWQTLDAFFNLDQDATPAKIVNAPISQYARSLTQELQLLSRSDSPLLWIAGLYYFNDISAYDPLALEGAVVSPLSSTEIHSKQHSASYAAFGQVTLHLSRAFRLTVGGRYTRDERRVDGMTLGFVDGQSTTLAVARQNAAWEKPTWRVALATEVTPDLLAYVSWDRGFKSGVYNLLTYAAPPVNPEVLEAYQAGFKSDWFNDRLRLNVAAYRYRYQNIQVEAVVAGATIALNAAAARLRGLDIDLEYVPWRSLTLRGAVAFLHGRYTDFRNAPITVPLRDPSGGLIGGNAVVPGDATGFETVRSPARTATVNARYDVLTQNGEIGLSAGYYHNSGFAWDPDNRLRQQSYGMLSASIDWTFPDERIVVRGAGSNLTGAEVCLYGTAPALGDLCSPRAPRTLSIEVSVKLRGQ